MTAPTPARPGSSPTFARALGDQLRADGTRPLVTFYDDATGERVELSVATYANWVAKTAGLLHDELDVGRGAHVVVDLPTHWLGPVWLGACWLVGAAVTDSPGPAAPDLVVCGPDGVERHASGGPAVVALSLRPLGGRFERALPDGVVDYGAVVLGQPDDFRAVDPPGGDDPAWSDAAGTQSQTDLLSGSARAHLVQPGQRLLTDLNPCSRAGVATLLGPMQAGGGTVWVRRPAADSWEGRAEAERAAHVLRARG